MTTLIEKAAFLIAEKHVKPCPEARVFMVKSQHLTTTYQVVVWDPTRASCNCPAGLRDFRCSHALAALKETT